MSNGIEGLDRRAVIHDPAVAGIMATRPDVPDKCAACMTVVPALVEAMKDQVDATEIHANCNPISGSDQAVVTPIVTYGSEAGNPPLAQQRKFCLVAQSGLLGTGH